MKVDSTKRTIASELLRSNILGHLHGTAANLSWILRAYSAGLTPKERLYIQDRLIQMRKITEDLERFRTKRLL
jgi:hypothetical protein